MNPVDKQLVGSSSVTRRIKRMEERIKRNQVRVSPSSGVRVIQTATGVILSGNQSVASGTSGEAVWL